MAAENNPFYIQPTNPLQALMTGVQGFDRGQAMQKENEIRAGRQDAMAALQAGADPSNALSRLIGVGDIQGATVLAKLHETQNAQNGVYGTPIYGQGPGGETQIGTFDKKGQFRQIQTGGFTPTLPVKTLDTGTGFQQIPGRGPFVAGQPSGPARGSQPQLDINSEGIPSSQAARVNGPQPGSAAPIQPTPVQTQPIRPSNATPGFIPKDIEGAQYLKDAGERAGLTMKSMSVAPRTLAGLNRVQALLDQSEQGKLAPMKATGAAWGRALGVSDDTLKSLGIDPNAPANMQAITALVNDQTLSKIGAGGLPANNFSDADRSFLTDTLPKLSNEPRANKIIIEAARRVAQLDIDKGKAWQAFKKANPGRSFDDFETAWVDKVSKQNVFGDLQEAVGALAGQQQAPAPAAPAGPTPSGGGWQVDPTNPKVRFRVKP